MRTAFRRAQAEARKHAATAPTVNVAPRRSMLTAVLALVATLTGAAIGPKSLPAVHAAAVPSPLSLRA